MKLKIEVTQGDIDNGVKDSPWFCPISRAVDRALAASGVMGETAVTYKAIAVFEDDDLVQAALRAVPPELAVNFMKDFDSERTCLPFSFQLSLEKPA